jgi:tetratricopeptide (TPR) repeat protein
LYSTYEGYQGEAAVREVLLAQQLNPNVGHAELAYLYLHLGLEDLGARELQRAFEIDPTSEFAKAMTLLMYEVGGKYDEYAAHRNLYHDDEMEALYFMSKGRLDESQKAIDEWSTKKPDDIDLPPKRALLLALKGDFRAAEAAIPAILSRHPVKDPLYHHAAYDIARIYALEGKSVEAVKWLRESAVNGFQPYPLFERDTNLDHIRQAPGFIQFIAELKAQNERYKREFS